MGCGGSKEADGDKEKDVKAKADADAAAKAKAAADAAAAAKAKADADAAAAAAAPPTPTDGKLARSSSTGGKTGGARSSTGGKGGASPRPSSGSKAPRGAQQPTPADHEANSSRDAPLVASRPDVDLNGAVDEAALKAKFKAFAEFGDGPSEAGADGGGGGGGDGGAVRIDAVRFAKLCRDSGLVDGKKLPLGGVDVAFEGGLAAAAAKGLDVSGRKLDYAGFLLALELIAKALGVPLTHVQLWICASSPLEKSTQAQSLAASRPLDGPAEPVEPLKPVITANKLFKRRS